MRTRIIIFQELQQPITSHKDPALHLAGGMVQAPGQRRAYCLTTPGQIVKLNVWHTGDYAKNIKYSLREAKMIMIKQLHSNELKGRQ